MNLFDIKFDMRKVGLHCAHVFGLTFFAKPNALEHVWNFQNVGYKMEILIPSYPLNFYCVLYSDSLY